MSTPTDDGVDNPLFDREPADYCPTCYSNMRLRIGPVTYADDWATTCPLGCPTPITDTTEDAA